MWVILKWLQSPSYYRYHYCFQIIIIIIIISIIILGISFVQGINTYIPETNHVPRKHRVAAILVLPIMVCISLVPTLTRLYLCVSTLQSMCAVPNMAVFCSSLTSWFPGMLITYLLNDSEIVPVTPIIAGINFVFTFNMHCISIVRSSYFRIFSAYYYYYYYYYLDIKSCCVCNHHYQDCRILFIWLVESNLTTLWLESHSISFSGWCV